MIALNLAVLAFTAWMFYAAIDSDLAAGIAVLVLTLFWVALGGYVGLRVSRKLNKQVDDWWEQRRRRDKPSVD